MVLHYRLGILLFIGCIVSPLAAQQGQIQEEELGGDSTVEEPTSGEFVSPTTRFDLNPSSLEVLAERKYLEGDYDTAASIYRTLGDQAENPLDRGKHYTYASWLLFQMGQLIPAEDLLAGALVPIPDYQIEAQNYVQAFVDLFRRAQVRAENQRDQSAAKIVNQSLRLIEDGKLREARRALEQALELIPNDPSASYNLALLNQREGKLDLALDGFERLVAIERGSPGTIPDEIEAQTLTNLGVLYYQVGSYDDAVQTLRQSIQLRPRSVQSWNNLGLAQRKLGQHTEAVQSFQKAMEVESNNAEVANNLAATYIAMENWVDAVAILLTATRQSPEMFSLWLNLGLAQRGLGNEQGAYRSFNEALTRSTGEASARPAMFLASLAYDRKEYASAVNFAEKAISADPGRAEPWVYLGLAQQATNQSSAARSAFEKALELDTSRAEIYLNYGSVLFELKDYGEAVQAFERALTLDPNFTLAQDNLNQARVRLARAAQEQALLAEKVKNRQPLGVRFAVVDYSSLGLKGALVESVKRRSPAGKAGLRKGDIVLKVDGKEFRDAREILRYTKTAGNMYLVLEILRDGIPKRIRIKTF